MFNIPLRNLFQEKTRLAISVGGVAFSVTLIIGDQLEEIDGISNAKPFNTRRVALDAHGHDFNLYTVAYDSDNDLGKPARVIEDGKPTKEERGGHDKICPHHGRQEVRIGQS